MLTELDLTDREQAVLADALNDHRGKLENGEYGHGPLTDEWLEDQASLERKLRAAGLSGTIYLDGERRGERNHA